jgi:molybdopterin converting factor small subunit
VDFCVLVSLWRYIIQPTKKQVVYMKIRVRLFSHLKYKLNAEHIYLEFSGPATVAQLRTKMTDLGGPAIAGIPFRVAIGSKFVDDSSPIGPDDIIALIPPVQGG